MRVLFPVLYSLFHRIHGIPYLSRIKNNEYKIARVDYLLFCKIDAALGRQLGKLQVSTRTAEVFTRLTDMLIILDDADVG